MVERELLICWSLCEMWRSEKGCGTTWKNEKKRTINVVLETGLVTGRGDQGPALFLRLC